MTRINSISTRLYGNISFNSSSTLKKRYDGSIHRSRRKKAVNIKKEEGTETDICSQTSLSTLYALQFTMFKK